MTRTEINGYEKSRYFPGLACCIRELSPLNRLRGGEGRIRTGDLLRVSLFAHRRFLAAAITEGAKTQKVRRRCTLRRPVAYCEKSVSSPTSRPMNVSPAAHVGNGCCEVFRHEAQCNIRAFRHRHYAVTRPRMSDDLQSHAEASA